MRQAMGVAVFSGMIGVTFFGLFLTPVFYVVLMKLGRKKAQKPEAQPQLPGTGAKGIATGAAVLLLLATVVTANAATNPNDVADVNLLTAGQSQLPALPSPNPQLPAKSDKPGSKEPLPCPH